LNGVQEVVGSNPAGPTNFADGQHFQSAQQVQFKEDPVLQYLSTSTTCLRRVEEDDGEGPGETPGLRVGAGLSAFSGSRTDCSAISLGKSIALAEIILASAALCFAQSFGAAPSRSLAGSATCPNPNAASSTGERSSSRGRT
jgi:hypothetical protein